MVPAKKVVKMTAVIKIRYYYKEMNSEKTKRSIKCILIRLYSFEFVFQLFKESAYNNAANRDNFLSTLLFLTFINIYISCFKSEI